MYVKRVTATEAVLEDVKAERGLQAAKHGDQSHLPDGTGPGGRLARDLVDTVNRPFHMADNYHLAAVAKARCKAAAQNEGGDGSITFEHILTEEYFEAVAEEDPERLYEELIQVAAVAVQWCEKLRGAQ